MSGRSGFTLVELMVALAVAAVLLGLAVPSFRETVISNRLTSTVNEFMAALTYARSEAIKRGQRVWLCKTEDGATCKEGGNQWETGWLVFLDKNGDEEWTAGDEVLKVWPALPQGFTLRPNNNFDNYLYYTAHGEANNLGTFAVCYNNQTIGAKAIVITRLRPRLGLDSNDNRIPENDSGDIASCFTS